uniref:THSD1 third Ig-like domain-containing protein n=1 Tax=Plectus sambesii TaxID=2011161 RepID=A0A914W054_9BILA
MPVGGSALSSPRSVIPPAVVTMLGRLAALLYLAVGCGGLQLQRITNDPRALADDVQVGWTRDASDAKVNSTLSLYIKETLLCTVLMEDFVDRGLSQFPCHCFTKGSVMYSLMHNAKIVHKFKVNWPAISLRLPYKHVTSTVDINVQITSKRPLCTFKDTKEPPSLELHLRFRPSFSTELLANGSRKQSQLLAIKRLPWPSSNTSSVDFECQSFLLAGTYSAHLYVNGDPVANSNEMNAIWFDEYLLQMRSDSIYPHCSGDMTVSFRRPACAVTTDRVRLFAVAVDGSLHTATSSRLMYIGEKRIYTDTKSVTFSCSLFDLLYTGFCFEMVSVLPGGVVKKRVKQCVPTEPRKHSPVDGGWSEWTNWSACLTTCGEGFRRRSRLCNKPTPQFDGQFCVGDSLQTQACAQAACPNATSTVRPYLETEEGCACGCTLKYRYGALFIASGRCSNESIWHIVDGDSHGWLYLQLVESRLPVGDRLRIQENSGPDGPLLYDSDEVIPTANKPSGWVLAGGAIIRYETTANQHSIKPNKWQGAIVEYDWRQVIEQPTENDHLKWDLRAAASEQRNQMMLLIMFSPALILLCVPAIVLWLMTRRRLRANERLIASVSVDGEDQRVVEGQQRNEQLPLESSMPLLKPKYRNDVMITSTRTESTRLSALSQDNQPSKSSSTAPTKRSIGIQLSSVSPPPPHSLRHTHSLQSTPSLMHGPASRHTSMYSTCPPASARHGDLLDSSLSLTAQSEQDFEYDYYEPGLPGSFLRPPSHLFSSEIDIDQIIGDSELMRPPTVGQSSESVAKCSVSTQIDNRQ